MVVRLDGFKAKSPVNYINLLQLRKENEVGTLDSTGKHRIYSVKKRKGILEGTGIKEAEALSLGKKGKECYKLLLVDL